MCSSDLYEHGITSIVLPKLVTRIEDFTFNDCRSLKTITIPPTVNSIGEYAFGNCISLKNIVIPMDESQSSVTTSSYRVAEGGMEFVNIYSIRSIPKLLSAMKGKRARIGTALDAKEPIRNLKSICGTLPALIVLGNEEQGISKEVRENTDHLVLIPFAGGKDGKPAVDSLNVAQAASIILYELSQG